jgi:metacaspase-1
MNSLSIGINLYEDNDNLDKCVADAHGFQQILKGQLLINRAATRNAILAAMQSTIAAGVPGRWTVITMSMHGGHIKDISGDEPDRRDEFIWTTECGGVLDDEIRAILAAHPPGNWVLVVADCCHAGVWRGSPEPPGKIRFKPGTPRVVGSRPAAPSDQRAIAGVAFIGACQDKESAYEGPRYALCSGALIESFDPAKPIGEWFGHAREAVSQTGWQHPQMHASRDLLEHKCAELLV